MGLEGPLLSGKNINNRLPKHNYQQCTPFATNENDNDDDDDDNDDNDKKQFLSIRYSSCVKINLT